MAGRIRSFKPEILDTDQDIAGLSDAAFKLYAVIVLQADDAGRVRINPAQFLAAGWWARPQEEHPDVDELLTDLVDAEILRVYSFGDVEYGEVIGWNDKRAPRYQAISKPQGARHPAPPDDAQPTLPFPSRNAPGVFQESSGNAPGASSASASNHSSRSLPGTLQENTRSVPVPIRSESIRSEPIQPPAPAGAIPLLPRTEPIPVDAKGHVTPEAIREETARILAQRLRSGGAS